MSRQRRKLSDYDKYLKPFHLAGQQHQLTITHVGEIEVKSREREVIIAGEAPEETPTDRQLVLHFREFGKPLRVNNLNREFLRKSVGDDPNGLPGCKITIRPITLRTFGGTESIEIVAAEKPKTNPTPEPQDKRAALVRRLSGLRQREKELLASKKMEPTPLTAETVKAMTDAELEARIELTESNIMDLQAA